MANIQTFLEKILSARYGKDVRQSIHDAIVEIDSVADTAQTSATAQAEAARKSAQTSALNAEASATSEANAKTYMEAAGSSEINAKTSETNSKVSENNAKESENNAKLTEERAREVFESIPEDYSTLSNDLYELAIKETASGEEIHVNDSSNLKLIKFALYGKAEQNTTQGNQLFTFTKDLNTSHVGVTVKDNGDGTLSVTGKSTAANGITSLGYGFNGTNVAYSLKAGTYSVSGLPEGLYLYLYRSGETTSEVGIRKNGTFTLNEDTNFVSISLRWSIDTEFNSPITKIMLNSGTTALPWEEYSGGMPSPNPQYEQPIEVSGASGSVAVKSCGKNYYDVSKTIGINSATGVSINNNSARVYSKQSGTYHSTVYPIDFSQMKSGKTYTMSADVNFISGSGRMALRRKNNNSIIIGSAYITASGIYKFSFTLPEEECYISLFATSGTNEIGDITYSNIQLEEGEVVTEYQAFKESISTIPTENGFAGIYDLCDEIVKYADGSGEHIQRIESEILTSSDFNGISTSELGNYSTCRRFKGKPYGRVMSNRFVGVSFDERTSKQDVYRCYMEENGYVVLRITKDNLYTTLEEFKNMVDESETKVYYELETPIVTPLTAEEIAEIEKLHTFYPITNISNDAECGMSVTYYADSKNYIGNQLAIMKQEQEEAMMNMLLLMPTEVQATMIENDTNDLLKESEI